MRPRIPGPTPAIASPSRPAPLVRRWAAWSLDVSLVALIALPLVFTPLRARLHTLDATLAAFLDAILQPMMAAFPAVPTPAQLLGDPVVAMTGTRFAEALGSALLLPLAAIVPLLWLYATAFECRHAATPGKRALRLRVIDAGDGKPACRRHALRQAAGLLSWLSLNLGHLMAAMAPRHQALHDRIAGLRVVTQADAPLSRWAQAWLGLQAVLASVALAALMFALQTRVDAALMRVLA